MTTPRTTIRFRNGIVGPLEKQKDASADSLANRFEVRETMIQRNLVAIQSKKLRQRNSTGETCLSQGRLDQARREDAIAQMALQYIAEGLTILLDGGSTSLSL